MDANLPAARAACDEAPRLHAIASELSCYRRAGCRSGAELEAMQMVRLCQRCPTAQAEARKG